MFLNLVLCILLIGGVLILASVLVGAIKWSIYSVQYKYWGQFVTACLVMLISALLIALCSVASVDVWVDFKVLSKLFGR